MISATPGPSDAELLSRHLEGEAEAFGQLVRRHRDRLWAVALRTLGDEEEAADALQDALLAAFRKADSFRGDAAVTTWLHRIVVNACLDRARRRSARTVLPLSDEASIASRGDPDPALATEQARDVAAALATLPHEQRVALVLVDMEGYSVQEAARILEVATGTVKSRCARGRARLLPLLTAPREQPPGSTGNHTSPSRVPFGQTREKGGGGRS